MSLLTHVLACLLGMGSWVAINGMWVELPLVVPKIPEGWYLPSYLTVLIQMANIGPLFITLMHRFRPGVLDERPVIYTIVGLGIVATLLLAFFWQHTVMVGGSLHSVPLLLLSFLLSVVDCTSSVTFLPFMMRLRPQYLTTYFVGEGLSGLVPALVALIQGVGVLHCQNATLAGSANTNISILADEKLEAVYQPAKFSVQVFYVFLSAMMLVCLVAFILLNYHPAVARERKSDLYFSGDLAPGKEELNLSLHAQTPEQKPMISSPKSVRNEPKSSFGRGTYNTLEVGFIFIVLAWVNALTNAVLPSVQSYSCLPYGNKAYHLAAAMAAVANPVACFIAMFMPIRSLVFMGVLTLTGTGFAAYIMAMAAQTDTSLKCLSGHAQCVMVVLTWIFFVLSLSYVNVIIGIILRDECHSALVWCGAVVQLGSMVGAVSMFPLVSVYGIFKTGDPCNTKCPL
ncbi:unnamed protein product, partial [Tetraodon nigroviridis]